MPNGMMSGLRSVHSRGFSQASRKSYKRFAASATAVALAIAAGAKPAGMSAPVVVAATFLSAVQAGVSSSGNGKVSNDVVGV